MKSKAIVLLVVGLMVSLVVGAVSAQDDRPHRGRNPDGVRFELLQDAADILTEATGLTAEELREHVRDGSTIADLIVANGGDVDAVTAEIVALVEERITEAQINGVITEERVTEMLENLEERVTDFLNREAGDFDGRRGDRNPRVRRLIQLVADATGVEASDIIAQAQDGSSLADILTANDVDVNAFIDEQAGTVEERLAEQVEAGRMSQEVADARLNLFRVQLNDWLNRTVTAETE